MKICRKCLAPKPFGQYYSYTDKRTKKTYLRILCIPCHIESTGVSRKKNPEKRRAQEKKRHEKNPEQRRIIGRRYRAKHLERRRKQDRESKRRNPVPYAKGMKLYATRHPDRVASQKATRRAREANAPIIEKIDRLAIYDRDNGKCHICKRKCSRKTFTLDHLIPLVRGGSHIAENLAVAHRACNSRMGAGRMPAQLLLIG